MEYEGGAFGTVRTSAVNAGAIHSQKVRMVRSRASLEWWDEHPNQLSFEVQGEPARVLEPGMAFLHPEALAEDHISVGHPEGILGAWSNLYERFAQAVQAQGRGDTACLAALHYPDTTAGVEGVRWVETCVRPAEAGGAWVDYR